MLRCFLVILLVTWCLPCTLARPARRTLRFFRSSRQRPPVMPESSIADMDQAAEASSFVDDYVPQEENQLAHGRLFFPRPRYPSLYPRSQSLDLPKHNKDCPHCDSFKGIVTLGESRSYSIVTNPRPNEEAKREIKSQEEGVTQRLTNEPEITTETTTTEESTTVQDTIISFRVSSSVGSSGYTEPASLLTEDRPYATAVQRSHFSVDEAVHEPITSSENNNAKIDYSQKSTMFAENSSPVVEITTVKPFPTITSSFNFYPTSNSRTDRSLFLRGSNQVKNDLSSSNESVESKNFAVVSNTQSAINNAYSPVSYSTSLKSATSGSSVSFYREPPNFQRHTVTEPTPQPTAPTEHLKHETRVETVSFHEEVAVPQKPTSKVENKPIINEEKSYQFTNVHDQSFHHVQVTHLNPVEKKTNLPYTNDQRFGQPEKVYGMPEENYEVDEAVSVQTNGRAHGVQKAVPDKNKFGYVVEGRDFKKYRVEERTADGFIVGEYGVVRHDDGSLRGVRYTADSTINPKVIYEALVKFLSL